ncbi:hypothetical protein C8R44DRAFT_529333, partial [Mycena epipterygia]
MTLKSYLELDPEKRATWAHFANKLLAKHDKLTSLVQAGSHVNMFLQKWSPKSSSKLPAFLRDMLKCARKYGVEFHTLSPSHEIRKLLPLWHHKGEDPAKNQLNNKPQSKCLRTNHGVMTVGQGIQVMNRRSCPDHRPDATCVCTPCFEDRYEGKCNNPHRCVVAVSERLDQLLPRWDPRSPDGEAPEVTATEGPAHHVPFKNSPSIQTLAEGFRIFTKNTVASEDAPPQVVHGLEVGEESVRAAISGYSIHTGLVDSRSGAGVWYSPDNPCNTSLRLPATSAQDKATGEVVAALICAQSAPSDVPLRIAT